MQYHFDLYGWYTSEALPGRSTDIAPANTSETTTPGAMRANFTGYAWVNMPYAAPPAPVPPVEEKKLLSKLGFRNRFTAAEKALIEFVALDNPAASTAVRMQAAGLRAALADQRDAEFIDPTRLDTRSNTLGLEAAGLLAAGRALQILDAPVLEQEQYRG